MGRLNWDLRNREKLGHKREVPEAHAYLAATRLQKQERSPIPVVWRVEPKPFPKGDEKRYRITPHCPDCGAYARAKIWYKRPVWVCAQVCGWVHTVIPGSQDAYAHKRDILKAREAVRQRDRRRFKKGDRKAIDAFIDEHKQSEKLRNRWLSDRVKDVQTSKIHPCDFCEGEILPGEAKHFPFRRWAHRECVNNLLRSSAMTQLPHVNWEVPASG